MKKINEINKRIEKFGSEGDAMLNQLVGDIDSLLEKFIDKIQSEYSFNESIGETFLEKGERFSMQTVRNRFKFK